MLKYFVIIFILLGNVLFPQQLFATNNVCGRPAIINFKEVLIDTTPSKKGEGLRFYLEKDPIAEKLLNEYQLRGQPRWHSAALGTLGTLLVIIGLTQSSSFNEGNGLTAKRTLIIGGLSLAAINFLVYRTIEHSNEKLLLNSIEEYNKRNSPKIYFSPTKNGGQNSKGHSKGVGLSAGLIGDF